MRLGHRLRHPPSSAGTGGHGCCGKPRDACLARTVPPPRQPVQPSSQRGKAATAFVNVDNTARGRCRREETSHGSPGCQQRRVGASGWELLGEQCPEARAKPAPRRGGTSTPPRPSLAARVNSPAHKWWGFC